MPKSDEDFATGKPVDLSKPEEGVRQEYERVLVDSYGYKKTEIDIEVAIPRGSGQFSDRADIVIYQPGKGRDPARHVLGIVETKKPTRKDGIAQIKSYMTATSASWGVWTNGEDIAYLCRVGTEVHDDYLNNIPARGQSVENVGRLTKSDLRPFDRGELKAAFRRILNTLYANTDISRREKLGNEMIKIIFCKLHDEQRYPDRPPEFRAEAGENPEDVTLRIKSLFNSVRGELRQDGIFREHDDIELDARAVAWVVGQLERGSFLDTDSDVVGDAFEVFSESKFIGEKGEFFTPRGVVKIAVKIANPKPEDTVCDPACGSGGFLIHAMKHIWAAMEQSPKWRGVRSDVMRDAQRKIAERSIFGLDKESDLVKIAKAHMAIAGDGRSNMASQNALHLAGDYKETARAFFVEGNDFKQFDMLLTNPPYGTKVKVLASEAKNFALGHKWQRKGGEWRQSNQSTDRDPYVLFVERCFDMLRDEGTLAIVLPETAFHAESLGYLRQYLLESSNIIAVIDLPHNTFRPHCNAKTCLLVLRKGELQQGEVIMATPREMGHDHQGKILYRPGTDEVWDDLAAVLPELDAPSSAQNKNVFHVQWDDMNPDVWVPRYYRRLRNPPKMPKGRRGVMLGELLESGVVNAWDGHGSPKSKYKGAGPVPYIRVSDIVNWELYRNPVAGIPEEIYEDMVGQKPRPQEGDIIMVRRGSYRIGTVAMASPRDERVLLTRELLTLRMAQPENDYGVSSFYLLAMLSSKIVQNQMHDLVLIDTTLPNLGDRWKQLMLPIHQDKEEISRISGEIKKVILEKWSAQDRIDRLRAELGDVVT